MKTEEKRQKAAILTWCYNNGPANYGQILQCYAMCVMVRRLGYDPKVIRYRKREADEIPYREKESERFHDLYELWYRFERVEKKTDVRIFHFMQFISEHIPLSGQCYTKEQVEAECSDCDVLFCGSDQIWNPLWFDDVYALNFRNTARKRIAYAPSGIFCEEERFIPIYRKLGHYIESFDMIAVREKIGAEILSKYTTQAIADTVDPTILLTKEDWEKVSTEKVYREPYIFCYFLGEIRKYKSLLKYVLQKYKADRILVVTQKHYGEENEKGSSGYFRSITDVGPAEFISLIRDAEAVCTDSFHGLALSVVYRKQFYVFNRADSDLHFIGDWERQKNLLDKIGIRNQRAMKCKKDIIEAEEIDYRNVKPEKQWDEVKKRVERCLEI